MMTASVPAVQADRRTTIKNGYGVTAHAVVHCPLERIVELRQQLGPPGGKPFPAAFLKPSDEQTIVAVAAALQAATQPALQGINYAEWAVIAAPRYLGRLNATDTISKFETGGAWKAPPLFVAHRSLHAVSGTISQALQCKGPNFGVSGGLNSATEGLLTALTLLDEGHLPGLWVVLTQCDPEPRPDRSGVNSVPVVCHAVVLAFTPVADDWRGLRLSLEEQSGARTSRPPSPEASKTRALPNTFASLAHFLESPPNGHRPGTWTCSLNWGGALKLSDETTGENRSRG